MIDRIKKRRWVVVRNLFAVVVVATLVGTGTAQVAPKKLDEKALVAKIYDLKPLQGPRGKAAGLTDTDVVIKMILETLPIGELKPGADGPQLIERENGRLEVRATAKTHGEINDLIAALERLTDVAVDIKTEVYEFNAGFWFDQNVKGLFDPAKGKPMSPVGHWTGLMDLLVEKTSRKLQTSESRLVNGADAVVSARQSVSTFASNPGAKSDKPQFVKDGFRLAAVPVVSADRRFVRLKLTEESTAVTGVKTRELGEIGGKRIVASTPELQDLGATGSIEVEDGGAVAFRLAYAPKDKVWLVVLRPTIFIQAEEDEIKRLKRLEEKVWRVFPVRRKS